MKKTTVITREQFLREVNQDYVQYIIPFTPDQGEYKQKAEEEAYSISLIPGTSSFMIQSETHKGATLNIAIYDLTGKLLAKQRITEGMPVKFPAVRAGLYLVEVLDHDGTSILVRQVIKPESGHAF